MAPVLASLARSLLTHTLTSRAPDDTTTTSLGPRKAHSILLARDSSNTNRPDPESGIVHPGEINNKFVFVLFGLIGAGFVALGIWFFFWARNGGFYFAQNDWDDYKSTVLRRKGPNGTTLSGATTETDLGGGSVYKDIDDGDGDGRTEVTGTTMTGITGGVSDIAGREKRRQKRMKKEREKERRREEKRQEKEERKKQRSRDKSSGAGKRKVGDDGAVVDEEAEAEAQEYLRNYRHERPARVGGINRQSDASTWDGSTNPSNSSRGGHSESGVTEELIKNQERTPTSSPAKKAGGGIRKVYSTADKRDSREAERIRAEARKLQEKGRAATASSSSSSGHRRNFSWQRDNTVSEDSPMMGAPPSYTASEVDTRIPGSWAESDMGSEVGTKVYQHHIPGLSSGGSSGGGTDVRDYAEERRKNRRSGGYRRER